MGQRVSIGSVFTGNFMPANEAAVKLSPSNYHPTTADGYKMVPKPNKLILLLERESPSREVMEANSWNPLDCSENIFVKDDDRLTFHRQPVGQSTDAIRAKIGYTSGFHVWRIRWPSNQRGTHATVGVATAEAPLWAAGYCSLVGSNQFSWGWDIGRGRLCHNQKKSTRRYPELGAEQKVFTVSDELLMILNMDEGTLAFCVSNEYLGVAFHSLKGRTLYPTVSAVWGHCEVTLEYLGGFDPEPCTLMAICRQVIVEHLLKGDPDIVNELVIPKSLHRYLLFA